MFTLSDFDFDLPPELIAQTALPERSASRLLEVDGLRHTCSLSSTAASPSCPVHRAGDLLVFNDTRVLKARFFGIKETGGKVEVLVERLVDERTVHAQVRASKIAAPGTMLRLADAFDVTVGERVGEFYTLCFPAGLLDLIEPTAVCRCRPISSTTPMPSMKPAIKRSSRSLRARWPRPLRVCISTRRCWSASPKAA